MLRRKSFSVSALDFQKRNFCFWNAEIKVYSSQLPKIELFLRKSVTVETEEQKRERSFLQEKHIAIADAAFTVGY